MAKAAKSGHFSAGSPLRGLSAKGPTAHTDAEFALTLTMGVSDNDH